MSKLLLNESPLQVLPSLAVKIGLNEAIALQQVYFRTRDKKGGWCYDSYEAWQKEHFPFWSVMTIRRVFKSLITRGLLFAEKQYNHGPGDHRLSVRVNRLALYELEDGPDQNEQGADQNEQGAVQNEQNNIHIDSPETPHRTKEPGLLELLNGAA